MLVEEKFSADFTYSRLIPKSKREQTFASIRLPHGNAVQICWRQRLWPSSLAGLRTRHRFLTAPTPLSSATSPFPPVPVPVPCSRPRHMGTLSARPGVTCPASNQTSPAPVPGRAVDVWWTCCCRIVDVSRRRAVEVWTCSAGLPTWSISVPLCEVLG